MIVTTAILPDIVFKVSYYLWDEKKIERARERELEQLKWAKENQLKAQSVTSTDSVGSRSESRRLRRQRSSRRKVHMADVPLQGTDAPRVRIFSSSNKDVRDTKVFVTQF